MSIGNGGFIGAAAAPTANAASGIWTMPEVINYRKTGSWPSPDDPYYANVGLLLHGNGTNGSTTFTDNGPYAFTPFAFAGNVAISTAQSKFGGASMAFDGSGDYIQYSPNAIFAFPADFTVEMWVYFTSIVSAAGLFSVNTENTGGWNGGANGLALTPNAVFCGTINNAAFTSGATTGAWYHYAMTRSGSSVKVFVNGVTKYTGTDSSSIGSSTTAYPGVGLLDKYLGTYRLFHNGYIDDLRVTKGVARYTADFSPPTTAFLP